MSERPPFGARAVGTYMGQRIHVRYGTSKLGPDWELIHHDLFGHLPFDEVTDVVLELCPKCGTDHEGWEPGTFGAETRCIRAQALALGADNLVDQVDALVRDVGQRRDTALRGQGFIP